MQKEKVAKAFNKWLDGKPLAKVMPGEAVNFLIFKEMEGKGRTVVHRETCPRLGTTDIKMMPNRGMRGKARLRLFEIRLF